MPREPSDELSIDLQLLEGFEFACRPDCGLCCYAEPAATGAERARLLKIEPELPFRPESREYSRIGARPDGGACALLTENRCRAHAARPHPCRAFPVHVHIGERVQASLVLSCPGVALGPLAGWQSGSPRPTPKGLDGELAAVREEFEGSPVELLRSDATGRLARELRRRGVEPRELEGLRARARAQLPAPEPEILAEFAPPLSGGPLDEEPIFWDARLGLVLLSSSEDGLYVASRAREAGGVSALLGEFPLPEASPRLTSPAQQLLDGYLAYLGERDHFLWSVLAEGAVAASRSFEEEYLGTLAAVKEELLARASVRARLLGETGEKLDAEELGRGIRAMDNDLLDRPTLGSIL
ncbi:MAG: YkgJ family cysteine cluster protein [Thermoplasmata archaeon]|nr:YkgJ family cysteine cluster protein [Thermoplasmata archaeon]